MFATLGGRIPMNSPKRLGVGRGGLGVAVDLGVPAYLHEIHGREEMAHDGARRPTRGQSVFKRRFSSAGRVRCGFEPSLHCPLQDFFLPSSWLGPGHGWPTANVLYHPPSPATWSCPQCALWLAAARCPGPIAPLSTSAAAVDSDTSPIGLHFWWVGSRSW